MNDFDKETSEINFLFFVMIFVAILIFGTSILQNLNGSSSASWEDQSEQQERSIFSNRRVFMNQCTSELKSSMSSSSARKNCSCIWRQRNKFPYGTDYERVMFGNQICIFEELGRSGMRFDGL